MLATATPANITLHGQVLTDLLLSVPEARLNLCLFHIRHGRVTDAFDLIEQLEPISTEDFFVKGAVLTCLDKGSQQSSIPACLQDALLSS